MASSENWRELYPFKPHELQIDGLRYHYLDEGAGEPLLFVHGNPTWSFYWRNLVTALSGEYRTIAVDHIGCGLSDKPQQYNYTLAQHGANLVRLIEHLDLRDYTLVGHDWGGAIGLAAALETLDRVGRVVLLNTGAFPPPYVPWQIRMCRIPLFGSVALRGFNGFARSALTMAVEKHERMTPQVKAGLIAPYDNWRNRVAVHAFVCDVPLTRRHPTFHTLAEIERRLPELADRPAQLIWGLRDWCFRRECIERLKKSLPDAEVHGFEDAGHYVVEDAHERIVPLLENFLRQTSPNAGTPNSTRQNVAAES